MKRMNSMQTKDLVAEAIRNEILAGGMEAGEELKQELLAQMLGVSRMPVREALQMLELEGYIERLPNRHMAVAAMDAVKIKGIMGMITAMETEIVLQGSAVESEVTETLLTSMKRALDREDFERAAEYELEYHYTLVRILNITYIEQLFSKAIGGYVSYLIQKRTQELSERYLLLDCINQNRKDGTSEEIRRSIESYYQTLFDSWNRKESM